MQGSLHLDALDNDALDDMGILGDVETESVDDGTCPDGSVDDASLCIAFHLVRTRWRDQDSVTAAGIPALHQPSKEFPDLSLDNFTPTVADTASGIRKDFSTDTLYLINRLQIEIFARSRGQKIIIFPARHTRYRKAMRNINIDRL